MELHVDAPMFAGMRRAAMKAELDGFDPCVAAWRFTGLELPPLPTAEIAVKVTLSTTGLAKLVP